MNLELEISEIECKKKSVIQVYSGGDRLCTWYRG